MGRTGHKPVIDDDNEGVLLLLHGDGFCQHNEKQNKQAKPGLCDLTEPPSGAGAKGVLVYSYGSPTAFAQKLAAAGSSASVMSACDPNVMHGAYDQGFNPSGAIFRAFEPDSGGGDNDDGGVVSVAAVHEGVAGGANHAAIDVGMCGLPKPRPGSIVLDGWRLAMLSPLL